MVEARRELSKRDALKLMESRIGEVGGSNRNVVLRVMKRLMNRRMKRRRVGRVMNAMMMSNEMLLIHTKTLLSFQLQRNASST